MYQGMYNGSKKHEPDLDKVLLRAWNIGIQKIIVTAGNYDECVRSLELVKSDGNFSCCFILRIVCKCIWYYII